MSDRREVRVANSFFEELDSQLGPERGPNGEPSATDFIVIDLPRIIDEFARRFDELPEAVAGVVFTGLLGRLLHTCVPLS